MNRVELIVEPGNRSSVAALLARRLPGAALSHDPDGAPLLEGSDLRISISHSRHFVALALDSSRRIGVDIEEPRPEQLARVMDRFLSPAERARWGDDLLGAWTVKEAVYKAAGVKTLALADIDTSAPGLASLPDGRRFAVETTRTPLYTLTLAIPAQQ